MAEIMSESYPDVIRFTLGGSDVATEVVLPNFTKRVSVQFITNAGKMALIGTDGATIDSDYMSIAADSWFELSFALNGFSRNTGVTSVFLASTTGSTVVEVVVEA